jgi:hypothetical protein
LIAHCAAQLASTLFVFALKRLRLLAAAIASWPARDSVFTRMIIDVVIFIRVKSFETADSVITTENYNLIFIADVRRRMTSPR